jgi:hypothetical protein
LALSIDVGLVKRANRLAESTDKSESRFAEALIRVAIIVISRRTVVADSFNSNILRLADALSRDGAIELINTFTWHNRASLSVLII